MTESGVTFRARAASYEPMRPAPMFARQGRRLRYEADWALRNGREQEAEGLYRRAIERLVDAFLVDRAGHASCFTAAHQIGQFVQRRFGCSLTSDDGGEYWATGCGVLALHQRLGSSFSGITRGHCSICGREDFQCAHVAGRRYGDERCVRIVDEVDLRELSVVPFPEDPRCYRVEVLRSRSELESDFGGPLPAQVEPVCTHCAECSGAESGPTAEDIDQQLWSTAEPGSQR